MLNIVMKIAIQGQQASYHDQAASQFFGSKITIVACDTFKQVFVELINGKADYGVVAIENSLFGSINEVYDLLLKHKIPIIGEEYVRIEHCLIGLPSAKLSDTKEVHSHPVALAQCEEYLDISLPHVQRFENHDTAGSVEDIKRWNKKYKMAIASEVAAKLHGLKVLARNIETHHNNYTRFIVLGKKQDLNISPTKTSLILKTADKPGALYDALGAFAQHKINLSKLQSRPVVGEAWRYMFYIDLEAGANDKSLQDALLLLKRQQCETIILGSYIAALNN